MKRLTKWNDQLKRWTLPQGRGSFREIAERLASYENTGLTPEQIFKLKDAAIKEIRDTKLPSIPITDLEAPIFTKKQYEIAISSESISELQKAIENAMQYYIDHHLTVVHF